MTLVTLTEAQRDKAVEAAQQRYEQQKNTPDSPTWRWGKCPVNEYYALMNEIGSALYLGIPLEDICLYSPSPSDYKKPDAGVWDFKSGAHFTANDVKKGVLYLLWGSPVATENTFDCGVETCKPRRHNSLTNMVEMRGWNHVTDPSRNMHGRFFPKDINELDTIPWGRK